MEVCAKVYKTDADGRICDVEFGQFMVKLFSLPFVNTARPFCEEIQK